MRFLLLLCLVGQLAWAQPRDLARLLPDLSIRTGFAHDHGDLLNAVIYQGQEYAPHEATKKILTRAGWSTRPDRLELGEAWVREIVLFGSEIAPESSPQAELLPDGTFRYTATAVSMRGRSPGSVSTRYRVEISPEADLTVTPLSGSDSGRLP